MLKLPKRAAVFGLLLTMLALTAGIVFANSITGPSSSESPYLVRSMPGVVVKSILTTGDSATTISVTPNL